MIRRSDYDTRTANGQEVFMKCIAVALFGESKRERRGMKEPYYSIYCCCYSRHATVVGARCIVVCLFVILYRCIAMHQCPIIFIPLSAFSV